MSTNGPVTVLFGKNLFSGNIDELGVYYTGHWTQERQWHLESYMVAHAIDLVIKPDFTREWSDVKYDVFVTEGYEQVALKLFGHNGRVETYETQQTA